MKDMEKPPDENDVEEGDESESVESRQLSPEEGDVFMREMQENITGLRAWLTEEERVLKDLVVNSASSEKIEAQKTKIRELTEDITEQEEFIADSRSEERKD